MDRGKNKQIVRENPLSPASASANSAFPRNSFAANISRPFSFTSPSSSSLRLPPSPTSFNYVAPKPYFMYQASAGAGPSMTPGASTSALNPSFFPGADPFSMRGEKNKTDQNPLPPSLTLGNSGRGRGGRKPPDPNMDPKKLKRILSNRLSAQKSRIRKLQNLYDMEKKAESLQTLVAVLSSQVQLQKDKQFMMTIEKRHLQNKISACANRKMVVDAEIEERRAELKRLRELHLTQQQQHHRQMPEQTLGSWGHGLSTDQMMNPSLNHYGTGQLMYLDSDQVDCGEDYMEEINRLNQLHLHQDSPPPPANNIMVPGSGWPEAGGGVQGTDVGLAQSGVGPAQNPYLNQQQNQVGSFNCNSMGELEKIFNFNPQNNMNPPNGNGFI